MKNQVTYYEQKPSSTNKNQVRYDSGAEIFDLVSPKLPPADPGHRRALAPSGRARRGGKLVFVRSRGAPKFSRFAGNFRLVTARWYLPSCPILSFFSLTICLWSSRSWFSHQELLRSSPLSSSFSISLALLSVSLSSIPDIKWYSLRSLISWWSTITINRIC